VKKKRVFKVVLNERNEKNGLGRETLIPGRITGRTKWKKLLHWRRSGNTKGTNHNSFPRILNALLQRRVFSTSYLPHFIYRFTIF